MCCTIASAAALALALLSAPALAQDFLREPPRLDSTALAISATSTVDYQDVENALDGSIDTIWRSRADGFPQAVAVDLGTVMSVGAIDYSSKPSRTQRGANAAAFQVAVAAGDTLPAVDGDAGWTEVVVDRFPTDPGEEAVKVLFSLTNARFVRLRIDSSHGADIDYATVAEFGVFANDLDPETPVSSPSPSPSPSPPPDLSGCSGGLPCEVDGSLGEWSAVIELPVIPVASSLRPDGSVLMWSATYPELYDGGNRFVATGGGSGQTAHAIFNPDDHSAFGYTVSNTGHDMFCPSISTLFNGDVLVAGGKNSEKTSVYDLSADAWIPGEDLNIARGYGSSVVLANGEVLTLGGSWSGLRAASKDGEIYDQASNSWRLQPGIEASEIMTNDPEGRYRADNYGWFFSWDDDTVFHAGPSTQMNWFYPLDSNPRSEFAGNRPSDDAANGLALMFDAGRGRILTAGGSPAYSDPTYASTTATVLIAIGAVGGTPQTRVVGDLNVPRTYTNQAILPDGTVIVLGGAVVPLEYSDDTAVMSAEIWDQESEGWTLIDAEFAIPRTYHSTGLLLKDGRILHGGGGLCSVDCPLNHADAQIFSPPYLFNTDGSAAPRPTISLDATSVELGGSIKVTSSLPLGMVSAIRIGGVTHSTNTDTRRAELCGPYSNLCDSGSTISVDIPSSSGVMTRGYWHIFGVSETGVPSVGVDLLLT